MSDALEDHEGTVSIRGRTITNLCFADNIDSPAGQEQELVKLVNHLEDASTAYGMQISAEKTQCKEDPVDDKLTPMASALTLPYTTRNWRPSVALNIWEL